MENQLITPEIEPYYDVDALALFDEALVQTQRLIRTLAPITHGKSLSSLEKAAIDLIPTSVSIAASIRELVRQAYVPAAKILVRPLIERTATLDYVVNQPGGLECWRAGWVYGNRPKLRELLSLMSGRGDDHEMIRMIVDDYNSVVHAEPEGCRKFIFDDDTGNPGYSADRVSSAFAVVENVCMASFAAMTIIQSDAHRVFRDRVVEFAKNLPEAAGDSRGR